MTSSFFFFKSIIGTELINEARRKCNFRYLKDRQKCNLGRFFRFVSFDMQLDFIVSKNISILKKKHRKRREGSAILSPKDQVKLIYLLSLVSCVFVNMLLLLNSRQSNHVLHCDCAVMVTERTLKKQVSFAQFPYKKKK